MTIIAPATYNDGTPLTHPETFAKVYAKAARAFAREPNEREALYLADEMTNGYTDPGESESAEYAVYLAYRARYGK
jgi:hypothetical protein